MNCERTKTILLADYLDGRLSEAQRMRVETHLKRCPDCRELSARILEDVSEPLRHDRKAAVPEYLWYRIQDEIAKGESAAWDASPSLAQRLRDLMYVPRPVYALATALVVLVTVSAAIGISVRNDLARGQYLCDLASGGVGYETESSQGYGTGLEMFL